jgi:succinate dehydrogenase / fumarate reductase flavoprotein subunit
VLVIGAGGAGLRAAIEASAAGVRVGLVCKSLLGKAHTVMAEGGIAAALANVDDRDSWKVHFATPCAAARCQQLAHGGAARREAPDRVRELRRGARSSIARLTAGSCSATSAATSTRGLRTSATGPGSR